jgi:hypothetical protein
LADLDNHINIGLEGCFVLAMPLIVAVFFGFEPTSTQRICLWRIFLSPCPTKLEHFMDHLRAFMRTRHLAYRTEKTYWAKQVGGLVFINFRQNGLCASYLGMRTPHLTDLF